MRIRLAVAALGVLVAALSGGCGGRSLPGPTDSPAVTLGGYTFRPNSYLITHPYQPLRPSTPDWTMVGWGGMKGSSKKHHCSYGGLVAGVKTLQLKGVGSGSRWVWTEVNWLAQDARGNVHLLKRQLLKDENGRRHPAQLMGVAAKQPALFYAPAMRDLHVGSTWYWQQKGRKVAQFTLTSLTGRIKEKAGLAVVRLIFDENGDGRFDPSWTGPDDRDDTYAEKNVGDYYWLWSPTQGFVRQ